MSLAKVKKQFFSTKKVINFLDRKTLSVLGKFGGLVRKTAQRSMRSRKKSQKSGQGLPPFAHGRKLLRKLLFYSLDTTTQTVLVGPLLLNSTKSIGVPKLMEVGGTVADIVNGKSVTKDYKGNPFMIPAFQMHIGKVAAMYKAKR